MKDHVYESTKALEEGLPLCNVAFLVHYGGSFAHIASTGPEHFHDSHGVDGLLQGEGDGTQAVAHQQNKSLHEKKLNMKQTRTKTEKKKRKSIQCHNLCIIYPSYL